MTEIKHPAKIVVPMQTGLAWGNGAVYQVKLDGKFAVRETPAGVLVGENVRGEFTAFDCVQWRGDDVRGEGAISRLAMRDELCLFYKIPTVPQTMRDGGEFLESVLTNGGEGVVRKEFWASYYQPMLACKRLETYYCRVTKAAGGKQSVGICDAASGEDRGRVSLFGGKADRVRVGSLLKVEGFGLTAERKIREPRPCKDTPDSWIVQY